MSIELPEAKILAEQMHRDLKGKQISSIDLQDYERLQRIGMLNKDTKAFDLLAGGRIESVVSRGNVIHVKLDNRMNLILAPEYGGQVHYQKSSETALEKFHLRIDFSDNTVFTVRLTSMGLITVVKDTELQRSYGYRRDFDPKKLSPIDQNFTSERFSTLLTNNHRTLKSVLVGKDAAVVGLSNSTFQDIIYRAKLHPTRRGADLTTEEQEALFKALKLVLQERLRLIGKTQFYDLYGKQGRYQPAMGSHMKQQTCTACGHNIETLNVGGGKVYFCPDCQV
ncbi:MAG: DNA-formamidopyrimidine glycosylase family protein [Promethearchaeota archaeon]